MSDDYINHHSGLTAPAIAGAALAPNDSQALAHVTRALYVGGGGDLRVTLLGGDVVTLKSALPGALYPLRITHLHQTGTTATDILGLR